MKDSMSMFKTLIPFCFEINLASESKVFRLTAGVLARTRARCLGGARVPVLYANGVACRPHELFGFERRVNRAMASAVSDGCASLTFIHGWAREADIASR